MRVKNLANNQVVIHTVGASTFHSYETRIATVDHSDDSVTLTSSWDYSPTTIKYLAEFLGLEGKGAKVRIKENIEDGIYKMES